MAVATDLDAALARMISALRVAQSDVRRIKANVEVLVVGESEEGGGHGRKAE